MEIINIPQAPVESWNVSKLAFKLRFPRAKWIAARQAAKIDPNLGDFFEDYDLASFISLKDPRTAGGVTALSLPQVPVEFRLTEEEVNNVLGFPCAPGEEP